LDLVIDSDAKSCLCVSEQMWFLEPWFFCLTVIVLDSSKVMHLDQAGTEPGLRKNKGSQKPG